MARKRRIRKDEATGLMERVEQTFPEVSLKRSGP